MSTQRVDVGVEEEEGEGLDLPSRAGLVHWPFAEAMGDLHAIAHRIGTTDYDEADRVLTARIMLLNVLCEEGVIRDLYRLSLDLLELTKPVAKFVGASHALALALGFDGRFEMFQARAAGATTWLAGASEPAVATRLDRFRSAEAALMEAFDRVATGKKIAGLFHGFSSVVVHCRLPWPWLAAMLVHDLFDSLWDWLCGLSHNVVLELGDPHDAPAPQIAVALRTLPGESKRDFLRRLKDETERVLDVMQIPQQSKSGRPPSSEVVERFVVWFLLRVVAGKPISGIAAFAYEDGATDRRSEVRRGIREATRLLGLSPYQFTPEQIERYSRMGTKVMGGGEMPRN